MSDINLSLIPKFVDNMLSPVAKEAGEALADIIKVARIPISDYLKKHEVELNVALNKIKIELEKIPDDNIIPPKASVIGPFMEDMFKYNLEEEHIIEAFSKLIAASMNKQKANSVHPQLFKAVEEMSPIDSRVFKSMFEDEDKLCSVQPYSAFYMSGNIFPNFAYYEIPLLSPQEFSYEDIPFLIKSYDSITYLSNIGLIKDYTEKINITEQGQRAVFIGRLYRLLDNVKKQQFASISLRDKIQVHLWKPTNLGYHLADILELTTFHTENEFMFFKYNDIEKIIRNQHEENK